MIQEQDFVIGPENTHSAIFGGVFSKGIIVKLVALLLPTFLRICLYVKKLVMGTTFLINSRCSSYRQLVILYRTCFSVKSTHTMPRATSPLV